MKIIRLQSQNVKRIEAVEITPEGNLVIIGGENAQGKSSVLDSIEYALGGKGKLPDKPVREGQDKATIVCELDDLRVTRIIKPDGTTSLTVTSIDGKQKYSSPQKLLDSLCGKIGFDPLDFSRRPPREQTNILKGLVGIDYSELDEERKRLYDERAAAGRDVSGRETQIKSLGSEHPEYGIEERSLETLVESLRTAQDHNRLQDEKKRGLERLLEAPISFRATLERAKTDEQAAGQAVNEAKQQIAKWQAELQRRLAVVEEKCVKVQEVKREYETMAATAAEAEKELAGIVYANTDDIEEQMRSLNDFNRHVRMNQTLNDLQHQFGEANAKYKDLTAQIEAIDKKKAAMLGAAKFPIKGLGFDESGVMFKGIPFEQCSSAEQLKISVAMGIALNPKLPVLLIRDGSLLDKNSMAVIAKMAKDAPAQVWIEVVREGEDCSVIIENGRVK